MRLLGVALGRVGAAHPPQREVGLDREREPRQPPQPLALVGRRQERIGDRVHPEQRRPRVAVRRRGCSDARSAAGNRVTAAPPAARRCTARPPGTAARRRHGDEPAPRAWSSTGTLNVTRAGPCTRAAVQRGPSRVPAHATARRASAPARPRARTDAARRAPPRAQPQRAASPSAKRCATRPSGAACVPSTATASGTTTKRSGGASSHNGRRGRQRAARSAARQRRDEVADRRAAARRPGPAAPSDRRGRCAGRPRTRAGRSARSAARPRLSP